MRKFVVAANWKMNKSPSEAAEYFKSFLPKWNEQKVAGNEVIFFVPSVDLFVAQQALAKTEVGYGAQNCYFESKGAFTGETSPAVLGELGARFTLVGHSERRALFHETDNDTSRKVKVLHNAGITPMLCVGETLEERQQVRTAEVITRQLRAGLAGRDPSKKIIIAYEPVWAIGTGRVATPEQANEAHQVLRGELREIGGTDFAFQTPILYGGSVKPDNAVEIAGLAEVDGFLVGGASLEVPTFLSLCVTKKS